MPLPLGSLVKQWVRYTKLAAQASSDDREYIHKLRVSSRRVSVTVRALSDHVLDADTRSWLRQVRRLARLAGRARDLDVRLSELVACHPHLSADLRIVLIHQWGLARGESQSALVRYVKKMRHRGELNRARRLAKRIERQATRRTTQAAALLTRLERETEQLEQMGRPWPLRPLEIHRLRRVVRRVRYLTELIVGCVPSESAKAILSSLRELQADLGDWHDAWVSKEWWRVTLQSPPAILMRRAGSVPEVGESPEFLVTEKDAAPPTSTVHELRVSLNSAATRESEASRNCEAKWAGDRFYQVIEDLQQLLRVLGPPK